MDRKFFEKVKREEPWLMHLKNTWVPDSDFLEIEFRRATGYRDNDPLVHATVPDPDGARYRVWIYAINPSGVEKIREVKGGEFIYLSESISRVISADDSVKRIAWHQLPGFSHKPNFERIIVIKPPKTGAFTNEPDLNRTLNLECYFR